MKKFTSIMAVMLVSLAIFGCEKGFSVKGVSPATGMTVGGELIQIRGTGFRSDMGIAVFLGAKQAENVVVTGPETLAVTTPSSLEAALVDVRIATDDGREYVMKQAFRYIEKPAIDIRDIGQRTSQRQKPQ